MKRDGMAAETERASRGAARGAPRRVAQRAMRGMATLSLAGAAVMAPVEAAGQQPVPGDTLRADSAAAVADSAAGVLPHPGLVVTALRTPAAMGDVPYAVTARRPSAGSPTAGLSLDTELRAVPGLQVHNRHNDALGDRIVIRGFGARAQFGVRGIQVLVDDIPATMPDGQSALSHLDLSILDRAEILRGPAASAYGNAAGGVLLLTTMPPPPDFRPEAEVLAGGNGLLRLRTTIGNGEVTGASGWVATVTRHQSDGFRPHARSERHHLSARGRVLVAGGELRLVAHGVTYDARNPGSLTAEQLAADPGQAQAFNVTQRTGEEGRHGQVGATWERAFSDVIAQATVYGLGRAVVNPIPNTIIDLERMAGGARLLVRGGEVGGAMWALGADAAVQGDARRNFDNEEGTPGALTLHQDERVTNLAAHAQATLPVTSRLAAFLAARFDGVAFSVDDYRTDDDSDDSGARSMHALSPSAGLRLDLTGSWSVFGNVSTAFETPTTTELVNRPDGAGGFNPDLEPQRTVSLELGSRARLGAVGLETSVYHARVRDGLVPFEVPEEPGRQFFRNAAVTRHRGVEVQATLATEALDLLGAYSRTDVQFVEYATDAAVYDGLDVPGVRPWVLELRASARPGPLVVDADYQKTGDMPADDANRNQAPGYDLVSLRASASLRVGSLHFLPYVGVDNVLDEIYVSSVVPNAFGGRYFEPGPGRTFFVGLETRFMDRR